MAKLLLASKADVNAKDDTGGTPLHLAAKYDSRDVAELLLANGADVDSKNIKGWTPLHVAAHHKEVAELLRQHGGHQ
jgi:ankyrin repeat protein